jgi:O-antigen/teichoic acid export membrane protein
VLMSTFSAARNLNADLRAAFRRAIGVTAALTLPAGAGVALVSPMLVMLLFGPKWLDAIPLISIMAPLGAFGAIASVAGVLLVALGQPRVLFYTNSILGAVRIILLILCTHLYGLTGAAWAVASVFPLECILFLGLTGKRLNIRVREWVSELWRSAAATVAMAGALVGLGLTDIQGVTGSLAAGLQLVITASVGMVLYAAVDLALWLASNRPPGPERFLLELLTPLLRRYLASAWQNWRHLISRRSLSPSMKRGREPAPSSGVAHRIEKNNTTTML